MSMATSYDAAEQERQELLQEQQPVRVQARRSMLPTNATKNYQSYIITNSDININANGTDVANGPGDDISELNEQQMQQQLRPVYQTTLSQHQQAYSTYQAAPAPQGMYRKIDDPDFDIDAPAGYCTEEDWRIGHSAGVLDTDECSFCCMCCQLFLALYLCMRRFVYSPHMDNLRRAICFGAIDGMLTGSSVVSASIGLQLFPHLYWCMWDADYNPHEADLHLDGRIKGVFAGGNVEQQRWAVVALTLAACCADGLCMGIGHVWSTYVLQEGTGKESEREAWLFQNHRDYSKTNLVQMLMARGMLKVDAMNIVDTLEGYPDLFIAASLGDNCGTGPLGIAGTSEHVNEQKDSNKEGNSALPTRRGSSSGRFTVMSDGSFDDEVYGFCVGEYFTEGLVMMVTFTLFSLVPALIHIYVPMWVNDHYSGKHIDYDNEYIHPVTVTFGLLNLVMMLLGFWKRLV